MGSKLADLSMNLLMPSSSDNMRVIAFKTIPSVSKVEIKMVLESMYDLEVEKVRTLNMQGKKKKRGGRLVARPNYKKAYVTLKNPLSIACALFPAHAIGKEGTSSYKQSELENFQEDDVKSHSLDNEECRIMPTKQLSCRGSSANFSTIGFLGQPVSSSNTCSSR